MRKEHLFFVALLCLGLGGCEVKAPAPVPVQATALLSDDIARIAAAFRERQSHIFVGAQGRVIKVLADDSAGERHQRFIVQLKNGQTLLIAHNIDIAPRIENIAVGDEVSFYGEYAWNDKGGVVHWTHHDPARRKPGGWIEHQGLRYQ